MEAGALSNRDNPMVAPPLARLRLLKVAGSTCVPIGISGGMKGNSSKFQRRVQRESGTASRRRSMQPLRGTVGCGEHSDQGIYCGNDGKGSSVLLCGS